jgi:perosamine synthetase
MIPVFEPIIGEDEIDAVVAALRRGEISGTFGQAIKGFEKAFADFCGCKYGIAVNSGTAALHIAVAALDVNPDDEILVSASTNIATALAAYHNNAIPVPVDSEKTTWNIDPELIDGLITPKTRAIIPVHLFGHPVDMDRVMSIAKKHDLIVIEDCAEAHGALYHGRKVGSIGDMGCFSFYANKVITTGEGGMVVTSDEKLAQKLRLLRNLAFTTPRFRHKEAGYNFRLTGYQAAMGLAQLNKIDQIIETKRRIASLYTKHLKDVSGLKLPVELEWAFNVYWMYAVVVEPEFGLTRDKLTTLLSEKGIGTRTFFCPMNQQPFLSKMSGFKQTPCPVADRLWNNGFYLPSSYNLTEETIQFIAFTVQEAQANQ